MIEFGPPDVAAPMIDQTPRDIGRACVEQNAPLAPGIQPIQRAAA
jgi:hypothetical protein